MNKKKQSTKHLDAGIEKIQRHKKSPTIKDCACESCKARRLWWRQWLKSQAQTLPAVD